MTKRKRGRPRKNAEANVVTDAPVLTKYFVATPGVAAARHLEAHSLQVDRMGNLVFKRDDRVVGLFPSGTFAVAPADIAPIPPAIVTLLNPESATSSNIHPMNYAEGAQNGAGFDPNPYE